MGVKKVVGQTPVKMYVGDWNKLKEFDSANIKLIICYPDKLSGINNFHIKAVGKTYEIREVLKKAGYRWSGTVWYKVIDVDQKDLLTKSEKLQKIVAEELSRLPIKYTVVEPSGLPYEEPVVFVKE